MAKKRWAVRNPDLVILLVNLAEAGGQAIGPVVDAAGEEFGTEETRAAADAAGQIVTANKNGPFQTHKRAVDIYSRALRNCGSAKRNPYARDNFWGSKKKAEEPPQLHIDDAFAWVAKQRMPQMDRGVTKYLVRAPSTPGIFGSKPVWYFLEFPNAREAYRASAHSWPVSLITASSPWLTVQRNMEGFRDPHSVSVYYADAYRHRTKGPLSYNDVALLASER